MKYTSNRKFNDENIAINLKFQKVSKRLPRREVLSDVTEDRHQNILGHRKQNSELRKSYEGLLNTDSDTARLTHDTDFGPDVIGTHFEHVGVSSDYVSDSDFEHIVQNHQDSKIETFGKRIDDGFNVDDENDDENESFGVYSDAVEEEEVMEANENDNSSLSTRDEGEIRPMEPIWNRAIFSELQYVMRKFSRSTLDEKDEDTYDVTMVAEYAPEIFNYMHELEHKLAPDPLYMNHQDELRWEMRAVLIDWVVQVHSRFNLLPETLFLTVNYIDRFLSRRKVSLSRFQLVGAVAIFIAAKYEEINCPTVQEVAYMADNAYSVDDFLKAERFMIDVLEFDMGWPGPMSFLRRTSKADDYDYETRTLAKYFLEITIMDARYVASQPSWLAAGAHYLSRKLLNRGEWTEAHVFYSGYTELQLRPLAENLLENCRNAATHHKAIFEKYQERRYRRSATFVQEYFDAIDS